MTTKYDYIIIGGGPTGITIAYCLSHIGKKCLLLDKNSSLGGCHRVKRTDENLFTEHGPRIYSNSYVNTINLFKHMNIDFYNIFTPYLFNISRIQGESFTHLKWSEITMLALEFIKITFGFNSSKKISVKSFLERHGFSDEAKDYIDRLCRLTDGAGYDRYSLYNFLQLINQQSFYRLYQPKKPNDIGLFTYIYNSLISNKVDIWLQSEVLNINTIDNSIVNLTINYQGQIVNIKGDNYIFAIPPATYINILNKNLDVKASYNNIDNFVVNNTYINDIPVVFHWREKLDLPKIWGFPKTEWGLAYIVLSDYMIFDEELSKTVISTCITKQGIKSTFINKTPGECDENELKNEVFRQLKISFPDLPNPDRMILHPTVQKQNRIWVETDTAYVNTYLDEYLGSQNTKYKNLYLVGTHNGNSTYSFTSFESAVSNALYFVNRIESKSRFMSIKRRVTVTDVLRIILVIILLIILYYILKKNNLY